MASVNRPTIPKQRDADINTKLQLYGIFQAFSNGKAPSNHQIDVALNSALSSRALSNPSKKLSSEGQHLVADLRDVIEQAKYLLLTKNEGNLLQDFLWESQQIGGGSAGTPNAPVDKDTAKQHGNQALDGLRTLGTLILSNGQFRKLLNDAQILLRDIAGDAAQKAANKVNPGEDELNQIDEPAEDNQWHDVPAASDLKSKAKTKVNEQKPLDKGDLKDVAGDATQTAHPSGSRDPADAADLAAKDRARGQGNAGVDAASGAQAGINKLRQKVDQNTDDDTKNKAKDKKNEYHDRSKDYLKNKIPDERRDQAIYRLKKMVVEIQGHEDYYQAIDTLLSLAEQYKGHSKNVAGQTVGSTKGAHEDPHLTRAEADLKTLIERFANSTSLDDIFDALNDLYSDADRDPELKGWFRDIDRYIRKCLKEQGYVLTDDATDQWNRLYDHGHFLLRDRYRDHTDRLVDELKFVADQFDADPQNTRFSNSLQKLFNDLGTDENGKATLKPHLLKDLSEVILPGFFENVRYVPIPRIEYTDPMMDAIVENLVIESDNLMPNVFEFASDNYFRWGRKQISNRNKNSVMVSVSGVQMDLKDVSYYVKKKQGFPSVSDKGVMDIFLGGTGLSFKIKLSTADKTDKQYFFKVDTVEVDLKHLNIKLKQSKHKLLFNLFKPLLFKVLKPVITKVLEKQIRDSVHQLDGMCYQVYKEAEHAKNEAKNNPDQVQNIYQRYYTAAQQKAMKGKKKSEEVAADKKVNVAVTKQDSMFKNISLPGGISTKATEYKQLAAKGEKWESPIFSIGSASPTSNIPKPAPVSRKPHNTRSGGIRGPKNLEGTGSSTAQQGGGYGSSGTGTGYGSSTTGYSNGSAGNSNLGGGHAAYGSTNGSAKYGQPNGSASFGNQVNQAFEQTGTQDLSLGNNGGATGRSDGTAKSTGGHTLLGAHNPVLSGSA